MKLLASPTSPYARLVRVVIHEKHLDGTVSCEWLDPWASPGSLLAANPFSRVPTLLADDGEVLTESLLIALYLDQRFPEPVLVPAGSRARIYRKLGLANGLIDAAVAVVAARRFGYEQPDRDPVRRRLDSLRRGVAMLDSDAADARTPDLGDLALAIGLAYLDFRLPEFGWRDLASALAEWYRVVEQRPSLQHTRPPAQEPLCPQRQTGGDNMSTAMKRDVDGILARVTAGDTRVPGVIAMATDRSANTYEGAAGERRLGNGEAMTTDTVVYIFSCTKAIAGAAVMQLVEEGRLNLDAPAKTYAPEIGKIQVLEGFDQAGKPRLRPPKRDITTRMLMLHTAGFGYDFFNKSYLRLATDHGLPSVITASKAALMAPLLFDPGEDWQYGINMDWAGQVVEGITGKRLGQVLHERIFEPLGMKNTAFTLSSAMRGRLACIHQREADGSLTPRPDLQLPPNPEVHMAGHGLYSTVGDYMRFIRMILNDGKGGNGRVLKAETVAQMAQNGLGNRKITALKGVIPTLSNDAEFFPDMPKSWGYSFMINDEIAPTGRPAGALGWAGLANTFYWIDRKNGIGGFWATQILPFADRISFTGHMDFETAVYRNLKGTAAG